jgi:hypothetical protein
MKRLSLEELKVQKSEQVQENLEAIKGGEMDWCHFWENFKQTMSEIGRDIYANKDMFR